MNTETEYWLVTWQVNGYAVPTEGINEHPIDALVNWKKQCPGDGLCLLFAMPIDKTQFEKMNPDQHSAKQRTQP